MQLSRQGWRICGKHAVHHIHRAAAGAETAIPPFSLRPNGIFFELGEYKSSAPAISEMHGDLIPKLSAAGNQLSRILQHDTCVPKPIDRVDDRLYGLFSVTITRSSLSQ